MESLCSSTYFPQFEAACLASDVCRVPPETQNRALGVSTVLAPEGRSYPLICKSESFDQVLLAGRWAALKTARIYINSGLAMLSDIQIPTYLLRPFHNLFTPWISQPSLEPVLPKRKNRTGGRGKKHKVPKRKGGGRMETCFIREFPIFFE